MTASHHDTRLQRLLVVVGIVVLAFNLRPAAVSVGPVLGDLSDGLRMNGAETGVLTSLPVLAFAIFGGLAPRAARVLGPHRLTLLALIAVVVGLGVRARVSSVSVFLLLSLVALAGMATANVLLPSLVRLHFPDRVGLMTSLYTTALALGLTAASVLTVPIADRYDGWRSGLAAWAITAAVAAVPWLGLVTHDHREARRRRDDGQPGIGLAEVARTRLGWSMALFFALQSIQAYSVFGWFAEVFRDAGFSPHVAGLLLGLVNAVGIPLSLVVPALAGRVRDQRLMLCAVSLGFPVAYLGLILAPHGGAVVWAIALGIGLSTFPLLLTLIGLRARTPVGTAALSGFTQSVGYLISVAGPFAVGVLHDASGSWTVPLLLLTALLVPQMVVGLRVTRPAYIEDELRPGAH